MSIPPCIYRVLFLSVHSCKRNTLYNEARVVTNLIAVVYFYEFSRGFFSLLKYFSIFFLIRTVRNSVSWIYVITSDEIGFSRGNFWKKTGLVTKRCGVKTLPSHRRAGFRRGDLVAYQSLTVIVFDARA